MLTDRRGFIGGLLALVALPKAWRPVAKPLGGYDLLKAMVDEYGIVGPFVSRTTYPKLPRKACGFGGNPANYPGPDFPLTSGGSKP